MKPSSSLHYLLHALTQSEKRYLRVYTNRHVREDQTQYAFLLECLWEQTQYDEMMLKAKWAAQGNDLTQLPYVKHYLYGMTLQAMRDFHRAKSAQREIDDLLTDATFLHSRGLSQEASKYLKKARQKAIKVEAHTQILQADSFERLLVLRDHVIDQAQALEELKASSEAALEALGLSTQVQIHYFEISRLARRHYQLRDPAALGKLNCLRESLIQQLAQADTSFTVKMHCLRGMSLLEQLAGDFEGAWTHHNKLFEHWETFPHMKTVYANTYLLSLSNLLAACHQTRRYQAMPDVIDQMKAVDVQSPSDMIEKEHNTLYYSLLHTLNIMDWDKVRTLLPALENFLKHHACDINRARVTAIRYNVAIAYFFLEEHKKALHALNAILHDENSSHRQDIQLAARLMQAVVHYQLDNLDLLDYLLRSTRRLLQQRGALFAFEETLIKTLKQLATLPPDRKEILTTLEAKLAELQQSPENAGAPGLQEVRYWVQSQLSGTSIRAVMA